MIDPHKHFITGRDEAVAGRTERTPSVCVHEGKDRMEQLSDVKGDATVSSIGA